MTDKNIIAGAPTEEPARQQYFMEQVKKLVEAESAKKGRPLTCFINTFGCQMNARDSEKLLGILKEAGYLAKPVKSTSDLPLGTIRFIHGITSFRNRESG